MRQTLPLQNSTSLCNTYTEQLQVVGYRILKIAKIQILASVTTVTSLEMKQSSEMQPFYILTGGMCLLGFC